MWVVSWLLILGMFQQPSVEPPPEIVREARALAQDGRYEEALERFRTVLAFAPKDPILHYYLGITLFKLDRLSASTVYLERAIELEAPFPEPYLWLGRARLELTEPDEAREIVEVGLEKFPGHEDLLELQKLLLN